MKKIIIFIFLLLTSIVSILMVNNFLVLELFTRRYVYFQIVFGLLVFSILLWQKDGYTRTNIAATVVTVVGVFGTFLGIYRGLQVFDIQNIELSIPHLLEGLKLSFITSLIGIGYALILKFVSLFPTTADMSSKVIDIQTSGDINLLKQLGTLNTTIEKEGGETRTALGSIKEGLTGIHTSLAGGQNETVAQLQGLTTTVSERHDSLTKTVAEKHDNLIKLQVEEGNKTREKLTELQTTLADGQSDLSTQLKDLATSFSTKHDLLIDEFQTFSENVAESVAKLATDELIEALKTVIENFNAKITEQFGENFKQLNKAIEKTLEWQKQYKHDMDKLANQFQVAADGIEKSRESVALIAESSNTISSRSESIVACTEKLDPILHTLNDQLDAFSKLRQSALEAFPLIESRLDELTTGFSNTVQTAIANSHESVESQRTALAEQSELLQTTVGDTSEKFDRLSTHFSESVENSMTQANDSMKQQRQELLRLTQQLQSNFRTLEENIETELTKCLELLAGKLAALSEKFVDDYTPLTEELYRLVNIARSNQADQSFRV